MTTGLASGRRIGGVGLAGVGMLAGLAVAAVAAPLLAPYDPSDRAGPPFARPHPAHPLGTNDVGQDLLSELVFGARVSLAVAIAAAVSATATGAVAGLVAGYARGWVDALVMRAVDVTLSLPFLPLAIVAGVFFGPGLATQVAVIAGIMWARAARELRAQVLSVRELDHVLAARAMGGPSRHVLARHVLPEVAPLLVPQFVLTAKAAILAEASLSFLGLGDPQAKSWGTMLFFAHARSAFLTDAWLWWVLPPGLCIGTAVAGFAFVGYGLEERARPRLRRWAPPTRRRPPKPPPRVAPALGARFPPPVLAIDDLCVAYESGTGRVIAVDGVSVTVGAGEVVGLIGESGSGKTTVVAAAAGLLRPPATVAAGRVLLGGEDLARLPASVLRGLRGDRVALVPQQAMDALNPVFRVADQLAEAVRVHRPVTRRQAREQAAELLAAVGIPPERGRDYPHQLSGGMRQRAVIAMALANDPALLLADEPTTGLDVVVAAEILALLADLQRRLGMAMLVVSHDVPVVLRLAGRVAVMREGRVVEQGPTRELTANPAHPYTASLLEAVPRLRAMSSSRRGPNPASSPKVGPQPHPAP